MSGCREQAAGGPEGDTSLLQLQLFPCVGQIDSPFFRYGYRSAGAGDGGGVCVRVCACVCVCVRVCACVCVCVRVCVVCVLCVCCVYCVYCVYCAYYMHCLFCLICLFCLFCFAIVCVSNRQIFSLSSCCRRKGMSRTQNICGRC